MIVNSIKLKNFGIFYGEYSIDLFDPNSDKNIILLGGENGSGKTTLLDAIRIALYGPLSLGYKTANESYTSKIRDRYFNIYAAKDSNPSAYVNIDIGLTEESYVNNYKIIRSWTLNDHSIREEFIVYKNGDELDKKDIFDFENYIRKFLPPALFNFFFFDGEKIAELFNSDEFDCSLKNSAMTMFNLDLFDVLKNDLTNYIKQDNIFSSLTDEEKKYTDLSQEYSRLEDALKTKKETLAILENTLTNNKQLVEKLEKEFKIHGGLMSQEHEKISSKILSLEEERRKLNDSQKEYNADILPFIIVTDLLKRVSAQLDNEKDYNDYISLKSKLNRDLIENILKEYAAKELYEKKSISDFPLNNLIEYLDTSIDIKLRPTSEGVNIIHSVSTSEAMDLKKYIHTIDLYEQDFPEKLFTKILKITSEINKLRKKQDLNLSDNEFERILIQIRVINEEITKGESQKQFLISEVATLESQIEQTQNQKDKVYAVIVKAKKDENIFAITQKINRVVEKFVNAVSQEKYQQIERHFLEMFSQLIRKDQFISGVRINKDSFHLDIIDNANNVIPKENLSAGEKQIYILSMLWAILSTSKREAPLVFDTLLGRLDHCHKENIIMKLLPQAGKQVMILSTNTEIDKNYYEKLKPFINKEYVMAFDSSVKKVIINEGYFY